MTFNPYQNTTYHGRKCSSCTHFKDCIKWNYGIENSDYCHTGKKFESKKK